MRVNQERAGHSIRELTARLEQERNITHHKIAFLMGEKQDAENKIAQKDEMLSRYSSVIEQLQNENKLEREMLNSNNAAFHQRKVVEEELRNQVDALQYKLRDSEASVRSQTEEMYLIKSENQNLQADLKNLISIEQALRNEMNGVAKRSITLEEQLQQAK